MIIIESLYTLITLILTCGCCYYTSQWKLYTELKTLDSSNPFPNIKSSNIIDIDMEKKKLKENKIQNNISSENNNNTNIKSIKILTQNLWCHYLAPSPCKTARINAFVNFLKINDYQILIIQEIFGLRFGLFTKVKHLTYLVQELHKLGYIYYTKPSGNMPYFGQNGGIMLFSKFKFVQKNVYKFGKSDEFMLRKGFAIGVIKIPLNGNIIDDTATIIQDKNKNNEIEMVLRSRDKEKEKYYYLSIGTAHCDPYRSKIIKSQINDFTNGIFEVIDQNNIDCIVGGDFNTRNKKIMDGLYNAFDKMKFYNMWNINKIKSVTYRKSYLKKYDIWLSLFSCGLIKLPSLKECKWKKGHCLDHLLTNIDKSRVVMVGSVDTRYGDVFVSDHMGVECEIKLP